MQTLRAGSGGFPAVFLAALLAASVPAMSARAGEEGGAPPAGEAPGPAPLPPVPPPGDRGVGITFEDDRIESPNGWVVWFYTVNFVDPKVLRAELDQWKTAEARIEPMTGPTGQASNLLRIQERKENLPLLEKMLEILDTPQPQVLVKAKLVEITYSGKLEWGFETSYVAPSETFFRGAGAVFNPESFLNSSTTRPFQGAEAGLAFVGDSRARYGALDSIIRTLKNQGRAEILGEPNILATQGHPAIIKAGEQVPIQQSTLSGNNLVLSTKFEETGIELIITPELIGKDAVRMKLEERFSAVTGFVLGQGGIQNPVINRRSASTTLTIRDGATLVVGGLQSSRTLDTRSGVPLLMDIPVLGWLFSTVSKEEVRTELHFIVTPEIIRGSYAEGLIRPPSERGRLDRLDR